MVRLILGLLFFVLLGGWLCLSNKPSFISFEETNESLSPPRHRILITHKGGIGEQEMAERIKLVSKSLRVECASFPMNHPLFFKRVFPNYKERFAKLFHPDIILSLQGDRIHYPEAKHYIALTHGSNYYLSYSATMPIHQLSDFDGYLVSFPDQDKLLHNQCVPWYTTCGKTIFTPPSHFRLFYCGCNMANTLFGSKYKQLFSRLDKAHYLDVYGRKEEWRHTPNSYRGFIKSTGAALLNTMHDTGVTLILHDPDHLCGQTPTAKIFESAASCTVIISDKHPFIQKEFGDAVLYIDQDRSSEDLFQQIQGHMRWIQTHPKEAVALAKKAHEIFVTKFSLEAQLENLIQLHQSLIEKLDPLQI